MLDGLLKYLTFGNTFCGVEYASENGKTIFRATVLEKTKTELVENRTAEEHGIEELAVTLPKQQHIHLIINTEKVLVKTIDSQLKDPIKLIYKTFPNIKIDQFYYDILSQGIRHFIALCRKDYVENLIADFEVNKLNVIGFSLGHSVIGSITDYIEQDNIYSSDSRISLKDNKILSIEKVNPDNERYSINGLKVKNENLLSLSGAIESVIGKEVTISNSSERKEKLLDDFKQTRFFNQFLKFAGLFILTLLLVNFFLFNHYFNKANGLSQISELNQSTKAKIIKLDESVSKKEKMVDDILKGSSSQTSLYTDKIVGSLPNSILLSELNYQPLSKRINKEKPIELNLNMISISGTSNDSEVFSEWISELEKLDWVKSISILDYGTETTRISQFEIKITLGND